MEIHKELAWSKQSESLMEVQKYGGSLEREVRNILDCDGGRVLYDFERGYDIQVDCAAPNLKAPEFIFSVTYTNPKRPGHSNENKLQLKLGELCLLKNAYPNIKVAIVIGGTREAWSSYVLDAFKFFFDESFFLWDRTDADRLVVVASDLGTIKSRHNDFWAALRKEWAHPKSATPDKAPPRGLVRYDIADLLKTDPSAMHPNEIKNVIARRCMLASFSSEMQTEWNSYRVGNWEKIEMSRSYFNPVEAIVELSLKEGKFLFEGGLARDVRVRSLLTDLGMMTTKVSEDFILYSEVYDMPVYIQCKSSGGGRQQHGKNIQNRAKEQIARRVLYTTTLDCDRNIVWEHKKFIWIAIVDGDWGVNARQPSKYIHMLELAGYDKILGAAELLDTNLGLKFSQNPLIDYLERIKCKR